jgi:hypothetical protein
MDHSYECASTASILNNQSETRQMATVNGTTQNKRKREPNESTGNTPLELSNALGHLFRRFMPPSMDEVNDLIENFTERDLQEAVLVKDFEGCLPIHIAGMRNVPLEVIQMLLDSD